jgi:ATP-dependent DNA ligase
MDVDATPRRIHGFRNDSNRVSLNRLFEWSPRVAFQRRKPAAIRIKAPLPGFIEPALATSVEKVPSGERWIHEIKFDGYRVQVHLANEAVKIFTRRGHDWTHRFKKVAHDAWRIKASSAIVDGEIVVPAENGATDFSVLQNELKGSSKRPSGQLNHAPKMGKTRAPAKSHTCPGYDRA